MGFERAHPAHISEFEPALRVLRDGPIRELDKAEADSIGTVAFTVPGSPPTAVAQHFDDTSMDAVLALKRGTVVYERYKTMRHFDKHSWFSASKTVAGTLTALHAHEGTIDTTEPVTRYVTELAGSAWDDDSVEATLDKATGLDSTEHDEQPVDDGAPTRSAAGSRGQ